MLSSALLLLCLTAQNGEAIDPHTVAPATNSTAAKKQSPQKTADVDEDDDQWVEVTHEPGFLEMFSVGEIRFTGKSYLDRPFRYRLFIPIDPANRAGPEAGRKWPLIVWLHGKGEAGDDNSSHLRHLSTLIFTKPWQRERYPFFLLALQCPRDNPVWATSRRENADDMLDVLTCTFLGADNLCSVYPTRPNACVGMQAGDEQCQEARAAEGKVGEASESSQWGCRRPVPVSYRTASYLAAAATGRRAGKDTRGAAN